MRPDIYKVATIGKGFLATMAKPRAGDRVGEEFHAFADAGVARIISLLEPHENRELGLSDEAQFCENASVGFRSFPLPDRGVPSDSREVYDLSLETYRLCTDGQSTAIHCRAGIGRSSLVAATVLLHTGRSVEEALRAISKARGLHVPDTEEQREWLLDFAARHHS